MVKALSDDAVDVDVGATEAIDRLLGIADDEKRAGPKRDLAPVSGVPGVASGPGAAVLAEPEDDLGLHRVRILEFVDEQIPELALERLPHIHVVAKNACRQVEKVAIVERVEPSALV